jgi:hypothetical protein
VYVEKPVVDGLEVNGDAKILARHRTPSESGH